MLRAAMHTVCTPVGGYGTVSAKPAVGPEWMRRATSGLASLVTVDVTRLPSTRPSTVIGLVLLSGSTAQPLTANCPAAGEETRSTRPDGSPGPAGFAAAGWAASTSQAAATTPASVAAIPRPARA